MPSDRLQPATTRSRFQAEAEYADSFLKTAFGDQDGMIAALRRSREADPSFSAGALALGSVEYQLGNHDAGRALLLELLEHEDDDGDLAETIDAAGDFLIIIENYADGLVLYRGAVGRFPEVAVMHQGRGCCAGHKGLHEEAVEASRAALALEPDNQKFVNDLGWCLVEAGRLEEARDVLARAVAMDPADERARNNLAIYEKALGEGAAPAATG